MELMSVLAEVFCFFAIITGGLFVFLSNFLCIQGGEPVGLLRGRPLALLSNLIDSQAKTVGLPTIKSQYVRSLVNLHENIFWCWIASVPIWIATRAIWFFAGESLNFLFVLALMIMCTSLLLFVTLFWTFKLPNSNSVLRVKSMFFAKYMELVPGNDPIEVAWKYTGGVLGITKFYHYCIGEEINTENEDELKITIEITYKNDVAPVKVVVYYKPAASRTDVLGARGKTAADQEKNVRSEVGATVKGMVETKLMDLDVLDAIAQYGTLSEWITDEFVKNDTKLELETGLTITKVIFAEIDQSKDGKQMYIAIGVHKLLEAKIDEVFNDRVKEVYDQAITDGETVTITDVRKELSKEKDEIRKSLLTISDEAERFILDVQGLENLRNLNLGTTGSAIGNRGGGKGKGGTP